MNKTSNNNSKNNSPIILPMTISLIGFAVFSFCLRQSLTNSDISSIFLSQSQKTLTALSISQTFNLFKLEPFIYKLTNVLIHTFNVFLVFMIVKKLSKIEIAIFVASIFAIHPIHLDTISKIANRSDLLVAFFGLLGCLVIVSKSQKLHYLAAACLTFTLSAWSNANGLFFVLIAPLLFFSAYQRKITKVGGLLLGFSAIICAAINKTELLSVISNYTSDLHLKKVILIFTLLGKHIAQLLFPLRSSSNYGFDQLGVLNTPSNYFYLLLLSGFVVWTTFLFVQKNKLWIFGPWFIIFYTLRLGSYSEHFSYIPSIGFFTLIGVFLFKAFKNSFARVFGATVAAILMTLTLSRIDCWKNDWNLLSCEIANRTKSQSVYAAYSKQLFKRAKLDQSEFYARRALEIKPNSIEGETALQEVLVKKERFSDALNVIGSILKTQPTNLRANSNAGWSYLGLQDTISAKNYFEKALNQNSNFQPAILGMYALAVGAVDLEKAKYWEKKLSANTLKDPRYLYWEKFI